MKEIDGRTLPFRIAHRVIKPMSFWLSLYMLFISLAILGDIAVGSVLDGPIGVGFGVLGLTCAAMLWLGWWLQNESLMDNGLLVSGAVLAAISATLFLELGPFGSVAPWLSVCVSGMSVSAWLLEVNDPLRRKSGS